MLNNYHFIPWAGRRCIGTSLVALTLMTILLPACAYKGTRSTAPDRNVTAQEVVDRTDNLIGKKVTIRSKIENLFSDNAFTISNQKFFSGEDILVINASGSAFNLPPNNIDVQVTGEVRRFNIAEVVREFDLNLQPDTYLEYEDKPVIIAQSLALAPKPGQITRNPGLFYNQPVAVEAEIKEVLDSVAFTLDEDQWFGGRDLLVVNQSPEVPVRPETKVVVTGIVRPFAVSDITRDYQLTWNLNIQRTVEAEYRNKPVLIAQQVFTLP